MYIIIFWKLTSNSHYVCPRYSNIGIGHTGKFGGNANRTSLIRNRKKQRKASNSLTFKVRKFWVRNSKDQERKKEKFELSKFFCIINKVIAEQSCLFHIKLLFPMKRNDIITSNWILLTFSVYTLQAIYKLDHRSFFRRSHNALTCSKLYFSNCKWPVRLIAVFNAEAVIINLVLLPMMCSSICCAASQSEWKLP